MDKRSFWVLVAMLFCVSIGFILGVSLNGRAGSEVFPAEMVTFPIITTGGYVDLPQSALAGITNLEKQRFAVRVVCATDRQPSTRPLPYMIRPLERWIVKHPPYGDVRCYTSVAPHHAIVLWVTKKP